MEHAFVVVAYGDSPFLQGCLESLARQVRQSRIIVSTSTPSGYISEAAASVGAAVRINPVANAGISEDWNFALAQAAVPYVTLAHQDDVYDPMFVAKTLELFERKPDAAVCFTGYEEVDDLGAPTSSKISRVKHLIESIVLGRREEARGRRLLTYLSFGNPLPCSSVTLNRAKLRDFRFSDSWRSNLDWDAWWRLAEAGETFLHAPERLVGRRHNALTATSRLIVDGTRKAEDLRMFRKAWPRPVAEMIARVYRVGY